MFVHHFDVFNTFYIMNSKEILLKKWMFEGFFGVQFFLILSGFVCSYGYKDKIYLNKISNEEFLTKRIKKKYPLYIISIIAGIFVYKIPFLNVVALIIPFILLVQSFVPYNHIFAFNFNGVAWTLSNLFSYYIVFPYFVKKSMKKLFLIYSILLSYLVHKMLFFFRNKKILLTN